MLKLRRVQAQFISIEIKVLNRRDLHYRTSSMWSRSHRPLPRQLQGRTHGHGYDIVERSRRSGWWVRERRKQRQRWWSYLRRHLIQFLALAWAGWHKNRWWKPRNHLYICKHNGGHLLVLMYSLSCWRCKCPPFHNIQHMSSKYPVHNHLCMNMCDQSFL